MPVLVPGGGHFFPIVKPQFFTRALRVFLARVETGAPMDKAAMRMQAQQIAAARPDVMPIEAPAPERRLRPFLARAARLARRQGDA